MQTISETLQSSCWLSSGKGTTIVIMAMAQLISSDSIQLYGSLFQKQKSELFNVE